MKPLIINRLHWYRGNNSGSRLLRGDGTKCCLGFLAEECGATADQIRRVPSPSDEPHIAWPEGLIISREEPGFAKIWKDTSLCMRMILTNDDSALYDHQREPKLIELFREIGYELSFVG